IRSQCLSCAKGKRKLANVAPLPNRKRAGNAAYGPKNAFFATGREAICSERDEVEHDQRRRDRSAKFFERPPRKALYQEESGRKTTNSQRRQGQNRLRPKHSRSV